jgi:hypothetical protein
MPSSRGAAPRRASRVLALLAVLLGCSLAPLTQAAAPPRSSFDHLTTGFELLGQHRDLPCESCHVNAIFKGTPKTCSACHGVGTTVRATAKPTSHMLSTDQCDACHTEVAWKPAVNFDHKQALGSCSSCHNGVQAQGKPPNHIVTDLECDTCHTTISWAGATFTHLGVTSGCAQCHNNVSAKGMPSNHMPLGTPPAACEACHSNTNFTNWLGATINHTAVEKYETCAACHQTANFLGMHPSTSSTAADSRPPTGATYDPSHPTTGDCVQCHDTTTFLSSALRPSNHIPTSAPCSQCHTTPGNYALYDVAGVHQGLTSCLACHGPNTGPFAGPPPGNTITILSWPVSNHIPIGSSPLDCSGAGCHTTANVNPGGFKIGIANVNVSTLTVAGHATVAAAVGGCATCHESAPYLGMTGSTTTAWGDSRPPVTASYDTAPHPTAAQAPECGTCHSTSPTFAKNQSSNALPTGHIPVTPPTYAAQPACTTCHTTVGNFALYSVTAVHQGVTGCAACHASATKFLNVTITQVAGNHFPIGSVDCNASGCHTTARLTAGGFVIGAGMAGNPSQPTLTVAGHTSIAPAAACAGCHESASYVGMNSNATSLPAGDARPLASLDANHTVAPLAKPNDCGNCHVTTPVFASNLLPNVQKPPKHIPTSAVCAQCHTTVGDFSKYDVNGVHQGATTCLQCHGPNTGPFTGPPPTNTITILSWPVGGHIPIGSTPLDCGSSGCHTIANVNPGGFQIGAGKAGNINNPTLSAAGHGTVSAMACLTCHEQGTAFLGMIPSTASPGADTRPNAYLSTHPAAPQDCGGCHTKTPTFATNQTNGSKPANHIPTGPPVYSASPACTNCHTTAGNYAAYSVTAVHQGVSSGNCHACHGSTVNTTFYNVTPVTTPANHIPSGTLDCGSSGCHTTSNVNTGGFQLGVGKAGNISNPTLNAAGHGTVSAMACLTCHEQNTAFLGMIPSTASPGADTRPNAYLSTHPAAPQDCGGCHTKTPTFATNQSGGSKPPNHIPTTQACTLCHTTAGNYAAYVMGATGHTGITSNCAQCHAYGLSFYNMAPPTLKEPPAGATGHIPCVPPNGTAAIACELCHSKTVFTTFSGTVMVHAYVTAMKCDSCHEYGMQWKTNTQLWTRPSPNHHAGQDCGGSGCHTSRDVKYVVRGLQPRSTPTSLATRTGSAPQTPLAARNGAPPVSAADPAPTSGARPSAPVAASFAAGAPFSHAAAASTPCATCHNGASGKPAAHLLTSGSCQSCHTTLAWLPVTRVDHTQVSGTCVSCHDGQSATAKPSRHIATSAACERCHTTNAWIPARFDHAAVAPQTCTTCHNAVHAIGLPRAHIPTAQSCDTCHGTLAWSPVKIDHGHLTASCASCHNNIGAVGLSPGHLRTQLDCARCHAYPDWSAVSFRHKSAAFPGGRHATLACSSCHTSDSEQVSYASAAEAGSCAGCHAKDFKPAAHPRTVKGVSYSAHELADCSGACHVYSDTTQSIITRSLPGPHHRVTDATLRH